jgi:endo-1,4-beta-xylanase
MRKCISARHVAAWIGTLVVTCGCTATIEGVGGEPSGTAIVGGAAGQSGWDLGGNAGRSGAAGVAGSTGSDSSGGGTSGGPGGATAGGRTGFGGQPSGNAGTAGLGGTTGATGGSSGAAGTAGAGRSAGGSSGGVSEGGRGGSGGVSQSAGTGGVEFVGNITTNNSVDTDGKTFSTYWNQITPENAGKWGSVQSNAGASFNWRTLDAIYDYAEAHGIIFKQHTFIWGAQQPGGAISEADVKTWMSEFCARYPKTRLIDVVNEPPPHTTPSYANNIGGGTNGSWQWIINAFQWAREACPNAILILNDYNNIEWSNDTTRFIDIVKTIKAAGAPIDAVGAQAHDLDHAQVSFDTVQSLFTRLTRETGLPVYITEMDISDSNDQNQLALYQKYIPFFLNSGAVRGITIWGWIYGKTWSLAPNSGLIRNGAARPAMTWLMNELGRPAP